jgi:hypothetical protein
MVDVLQGMKGSYTVCGLVIESELELPELLPATGPADVHIVLGQTPDHLEAPTAQTPWYETAPGRFLLRVDGIAQFFVENGNRIVIDPHPQPRPEDLRVFLLHTVLAALLHQRDCLVLHGAVAVVDGKAVALVGHSSVGKTAIALTLYDRGYEIFGDEICAIKLHDGKPVVFPGIPQLNVWHDTLEKAGKEASLYQPIRWGIEKYAFPVAEHFGREPVVLGNIVFLRQHNRTDHAWESIKGAAGYERMMQNAYFIETVADKVNHFKIGAGIIKHTHLGQAAFNGHSSQMEQVTDFILKVLR